MPLLMLSARTKLRVETNGTGVSPTPGVWLGEKCCPGTLQCATSNTATAKVTVQSIFLDVDPPVAIHPFSFGEAAPRVDASFSATMRIVLFALASTGNAG